MMETIKAKKYLPWVVATALFMEQLDSTIVNTAVPSMAIALHVAPLSLKAVVASYILSLAVFIPISGWMADRFGTRRVFSAAIALFVASSLMCGLSVNVPMLIVARIFQGMGGAMMMPVGRLTIIRTFAKDELLAAMNFVIIPALIGPLLGPTIGGLIVHFLSWRVIFFVNLPVGLLAQWLIYRYMPDYHGEKPRPLDVTGFALFGVGTALLSWLFEIFGEHTISSQHFVLLFGMAVLLLLAYVWHAKRTLYPLLSVALFRLRTFRVSVMGGFVTRLGIGGMPFLLPLLYQLGLGLPAWESGLLMMPAALGAMGMKVASVRVLAKFGYRRVLLFNTLVTGIIIASFSLISPGIPLIYIVLLGLSQGFFNSLQFTSINSMAYADIAPSEASMASTMASSFQQLSLSFGLAFGSAVAAWFLPRTAYDQAAVINALHHALLALGGMTVLSSLVFATLQAGDGDNVSRRKKPVAEDPTMKPAV